MMINEGYKIIGYCSVIKNDIVFAIGYNFNAVDPYVVWNYNKNNDSYSRGIYCSNFYKATQIMAEKFYFYYCSSYGLADEKIVGDEPSPEKKEVRDEVSLT